MIYECRVNLKNKRKDELIMYLEEALQTIQKQESEINKLNNVIQIIREEFLKYDWKNATQEQVYNQLKGLYESIFIKENK